MAEMNEILKRLGVTTTPTPQPAAAQAPVATPEQESTSSMSNQELIGRALLAFAPIALGAAVGGSRGGVVGGQAGITGLSELEKAQKIAKEEEATKAKAKSEKEKAEFEKALKLGELGMKGQELDLKKEANAIARMDAGKKKEDKQIQLTMDLRKERNSLPVTKATQEMVVSYDKLQRAANDSSAAGDLSLIFSYMKMLDPGSTVREGEFANAQNAAGVPDKIRNIYERIRTGERLNDAQRMDFVKQAANLYQAQIAQQSTVDAQFAQIAQNAGIDPAQVTVSFGTVVTPEQKKMTQQAPGPQSRLSATMNALTGAQAVAAPVGGVKPDFTKMSDEELNRYLGGQ